MSKTKYGKPGDLGGRGCHPCDPTGTIFGSTHWPLRQPHEGGTEMKYMLINVTTPETTSILAVAELQAIQLLGKIHQANGLKVIAPPVEGRGFTKLEKLPLQYLYWNVCKEAPPEDYGELVGRCLQAIERLPMDETQIATLQREVARLYPEGVGVVASAEPKAPRAAGEPSVRPKGTSTTGRVWEIADSLFAAAGNQFPDRKAIIDACIAEGINQATASTQYAKWKKTK